MVLYRKLWNFLWKTGKLMVFDGGYHTKNYETVVNYS